MTRFRSRSRWIVVLTSIAVALTLATAGTALAVAPDGTEQEPNGTAGTATAMSTTDRCYAYRTGAVTPAGDLDFLSFPGSTGDLAWSLVDTGGGAASADSVLDVLAPNGTTVLENDDDDGTGNGGNATIESGFASAIGGRPLSESGQHFARVRGFGTFPGTAVVNPYRAFVATTSNSADAESEPNGTPATANPVTDCRTPISGEVSPAGDLDHYKLDLRAGQTLFLSMDGNPEKDGTSLDGVVQILSPTNAVLLTIDSGFGGAASAESVDFDIPVTGTYTVLVRGFSMADTRTYRILLAANDIVEPVTTIQSAPPAFTNDNTPTVTFTQTDDIASSSGLKAECAIVAGGVAGPFSACDGPGTDTASPALADGAYGYLVRGTDASGNVEGTPARADFTVDTQGPDVAGLKAKVKGDDAKLKFTATDPSGITDLKCKVDKKTKDCDAKKKRKFKNLDDGKHKVVVTATDGAGNTSTEKKRFKVR